MKNLEKKFSNLIENLILQSLNDNSFKERLIRNPKDTIQDFTNGEIKIKIDKFICVEDQSDKDIVYLNIPRKPNLDLVELNEEELELISGGSTFGCAVLGGLLVYAVGDFIDGAYDTFKARLR